MRNNDIATSTSLANLLIQFNQQDQPKFQYVLLQCIDEEPGYAFPMLKIIEVIANPNNFGKHYLMFFPSIKDPMCIRDIKLRIMAHILNE